MRMAGRPFICSLLILSLTMASRTVTAVTAQPLHRVRINIATVSTNPALRTLRLGKAPLVEGIDSSAQRLIVASGSNHSQLTIVNVRSGAAVYTLTFDNDADAAAIDTQVHMAYVVGGLTINEPGTLSWLNLLTGQVVRSVSVGVGPRAVAFDRKHDRIFVSNYWDNTLTIVSLASGRVIRTVNVGQNPTSIAVDDAADRVYVLSTDDKSLTMLQADNGRFLKLIPIAPDAQQIAVFGPLDRLFTIFCPQIATCGDQTPDTHGALTVRDGRTGSLIPNASFTSFGIAPANMMYDTADNQVVVFDEGTNKALFLDPATGALRRQLQLGPNVAGIALLTHSNRVAALGLGVVNGDRQPLGDEELRIYDLHSGHITGRTEVSQGTDSIAGDDLNNRVFLVNTNDATLQTIDPARV